MVRARGFHWIVTFGGIYTSLLKEEKIKEFSPLHFRKNDSTNYFHYKK